MFYSLNNKKKSIARKGRVETCLNGRTALTFFVKTVRNKNFSETFLQSRLISHFKQTVLATNNEDNSVPNRILPRQQPGLYMIRCTVNDWRYYGESSNVSGRLASHKSLLNRLIHPNKNLQTDWNLFGQAAFEFVVLFMGHTWTQSYIRRGKETELIVLDRQFCYNILEDSSRPGSLNPFWKKIHSPETKKKICEALKDRPNTLLGKKISVRGIEYPSIAEASRQTNIARKTIRNKIADSTISDFFEI